MRYAALPRCAFMVCKQTTAAAVDHTKTKVKSPQTNGICERFHKTILQEFYQVTFRKKLYESIDALQADLDDWLHH